MKVSNNQLEKLEIILYGLALGMIILAVVSYTYMQRSTGMLPVISYPYRPYSIPLVVIGVLIVVIGVITRFARK